MKVDDAVLIDYALGTLPPEQVKEVESLLRAQPGTALWVRRTQDDLARLVMSLSPEITGEAAEEALAERLRQALRTHPRRPLAQPEVRANAARRSPRWAALGLAAALGIAAWLILGPFIGSDRFERTLRHYQSEPGAVSFNLVTSEGRELGTLVRLEDGRLFVNFDQQPGEGVYQLWHMSEGEPESLGVVDGRALLTGPVAGGGSVAVTVEPLGGSHRPTSDPLLLQTF